MNRKTFASLSIVLVLTLFAMGSLPLAASDTPNVPLGITETPVATETSTNTPPAPTNTPTNTPAPTKAPAQSPVNTAVPATPMPTLTSVSTPTATRVVVLSVSGGPADPADAPSRIPEIIALMFGALAALAIGSNPRPQHTPRK